MFFILKPSNSKMMTHQTFQTFELIKSLCRGCIQKEKGQMAAAAGGNSSLTWHRAGTGPSWPHNKKSMSLPSLAANLHAAILMDAMVAGHSGRGQVTMLPILEAPSGWVWPGEDGQHWELGPDGQRMCTSCSDICLCGPKAGKGVPQGFLKAGFMQNWHKKKRWWNILLFFKIYINFNLLEILDFNLTF